MNAQIKQDTKHLSPIGRGTGRSFHKGLRGQIHSVGYGSHIFVHYLGKEKKKMENRLHKEGMEI